VLKDIVGHGPILSFGFMGPCHVTTKIGGFAFESLEFIVCFKNISSERGRGG
jgi:hypothetical protein